MRQTIVRRDECGKLAAAETFLRKVFLATILLVSEVIHISSILLHLIGLENLCSLFDQSEAKFKPISA